MNRKSRWFAAIMAMFFGTFGVHKLYLGKIGGFIGYFFLFMLSISIISLPLTFILGLIDSFKIMSMTDEQFDQKYNMGVPSGIPRGRLEKRRQEQMQKYNPPIKHHPASFKNKSSANSLKKSGLKKYKDFDLEDAIDDFKKVIEIVPQDASTHFNLACAYSLTEKKQKAFEHLSKAVEFGMNDVNTILTHDDLAYIRIQPEFDLFRSAGFRMSNEKTVPGQQDALLSQLQKLSDLRNRGLLSDDEFNMERKKILRQ
ncbi:MAG: NINE protein [Saprospiraceae bacterium]